MLAVYRHTGGYGRNAAPSPRMEDEKAAICCLFYLLSNNFRTSFPGAFAELASGPV
ncbi:hypothetical protein BJX66DRAFT_312295 [Aspergillus keveii]|uniref:Uncharacterized protein n=1 Tax=Aspergillus keveii TaxID=714993 RepID=A0ABR4FU11_9EURO